MNSEQETIPTFYFEESKNFNKNNITKLDILKNNECFILENVMNEEECLQLVNQGEKYNFKELPLSQSSYRTNKRIININFQLSTILWNRIKDFLDDTIEIKGRHETLRTTYFTDGIWKIDGLNNNFRLCKYNPTNFFKKHFDEGYHPDPKNHRSFKTCMLYLNSDFEDGETVFYFGDKKEFKLKAKIGTCLIFNQNILHEGMPVKNGLKYFIRTDVFYKKIYSPSNENLTSIQCEALKLYDQAVEFDKNNDNDNAIKYYKKATKLYDDIEFLYNSLY